MRSPDLLDRIAPELPPFFLSPERSQDCEGPASPTLAFDPPAAPSEQVPQPFLEAGDREPGEQTSADAARDRPVESVRRKLWPLTLIGSIALHLLPFGLLLLAWPFAPAEVAAPIPVQLVMEQPKPPPPAARPPAPEKKPPPPGRLASEDLGNPAAKQRQPGSEAAPSAPPQTPEKLVSAIPLEKPPPPPLPEPDALPQQQAMLPPLPKPAAPRRDAAPPEARQQRATLRRPHPSAAPAPSVIRMAGSWTPLPAHLGALGPAASEDPYLAECNALILRNIGMLSPSVIGNRRGQVEIELSVADDGRISGVKVMRSSGYPDIDERVERMVTAVGRFPPMPQRFQPEFEGQRFSMIFFAAFDQGGLIRR